MASLLQGGFRQNKNLASSSTLNIVVIAHGSRTFYCAG